MVSTKTARIGSWTRGKSWWWPHPGGDTVTRADLARFVLSGYHAGAGHQDPVRVSVVVVPIEGRVLRVADRVPDVAEPVGARHTEDPGAALVVSQCRRARPPSPRPHSPPPNSPLVDSGPALAQDAVVDPAPAFDQDELVGFVNRPPPRIEPVQVGGERTCRFGTPQSPPGSCHSTRAVKVHPERVPVEHDVLHHAGR